MITILVLNKSQITEKYLASRLNWNPTPNSMCFENWEILKVQLITQLLTASTTVSVSVKE